MRKADALIGKRFEELTVLGISHYKNYAAYMRCKCSCGNETIVYYPNLLRGLTKSCGCRKQRFSKDSLQPHYTDLWNIWYAMKRRCYCEQEREFPHYGGRGITVCDEWRNDFQAFYGWAMDNGYAGKRKNNNKFLSIDRINVNGNYEPSNCRWATMREQALNKRNNCYVFLNGQELTVKEAAEALNVGYMKLYNALYKNGFNMAKALESVKKEYRVKISFGGCLYSLRELSEKTKIPYRRLRSIYNAHADKKYLETKLQDEYFLKSNQAFGD